MKGYVMNKNNFNGESGASSCLVFRWNLPVSGDAGLELTKKMHVHNNITL